MVGVSFYDRTSIFLAAKARGHHGHPGLRTTGVSDRGIRDIGDHGASRASDSVGVQHSERSLRPGLWVCGASNVEHPGLPVSMDRAGTLAPRHHCDQGSGDAGHPGLWVSGILITGQPGHRVITGPGVSMMGHPGLWGTGHPDSEHLGSRSWGIQDSGDLGIQDSGTSLRPGLWVCGDSIMGYPGSPSSARPGFRRTGVSIMGILVVWTTGHPGLWMRGVSMMGAFGTSALTSTVPSYTDPDHGFQGADLQTAGTQIATT